MNAVAQSLDSTIHFWLPLYCCSTSGYFQASSKRPSINFGIHKVYSSRTPIEKKMTLKLENVHHFLVVLVCTEWLLSKCKKSEKTSECQFTRKRVKATQKKLLSTRKREKIEKKVRFFTRKRVKKESKWTRVNTTQKCIVLRLNL